MRRIGLPPEPRRFLPHVTLARLHGSSPPAVADAIAGRGFFPTRSFEASRFALFSSRDSTGGGPYRIEETYPLDPRPTSAAALWRRPGGSPSH